ncbi:flavin reductase family protein [Nostocoides sp.]|uniref:flavin reductase family protein n=1 Tax=Nostocoides sp. TaxID=1917966 RepID=UPI002BE8662D|nr:flavin reductase family protein [Tetrasphaera sp.]
MTAYQGPMVDSDEFRAAMGRLASGVVVLSANDGRHDHAMTATAFTSVSLDPPLVLACVERAARFHDLVLASGGFGVSILGVGQRAAAEWLATPGRPLVDQFERIPHRRGGGGAILLTESIATLECRTSALHPAGDHSILVGEVIATTLIDTPDEALVHYRSRYGSLA